MYRPVLRLPNLLLILTLLACASYAAGPRLRYGEPIRYDDNAPKVLPDFTLRYSGYTPHVVHVGGETGRDFDFGTHDFELSAGNERLTVHWSQGTGVIRPEFFEIGGQPFVLELIFTETQPAGARSVIPHGSVLLWKRADFDRRVARKEKS